MMKIVNGVEVEMSVAAENAWLAEQALYQPATPPLTKLYKSTFIRRMSASEATVFEAQLAAEEPWLRLLYNSVEYFMADDALVAYLYMALEAAFEEGRADLLLAPEA